MKTEPPENIFTAGSFLYLQGLLHFILVILLLFFSALVSGSEVAFLSLDKKRLEAEKKKNPHTSAKVDSVLKDQKKLLATILIANNFLNIGIVILTSSLIRTYLQFPEIHIYGIDISFKFLTEVVGITFLLLLFGEIIPKIYASRDNFRFAVFMSRPLFFSSQALSPLSTMMMWIYGFVEHRLGQRKHTLSVDQLSQALEITVEDKKDDKERRFLQGIVDFGSIETRQVMTPRIDMFALKYDTPFAEVLHMIISESYSRIPVYQESIDDIEGVLFVKDLLPLINKKEYPWTQLIHQPFFVPENKKLDDLLNDFKNKRIHLAIVVDEYGGTCGVVTLEDVIEEIIGDISDEFDEENTSYSKIDHDSYIFEGKTPLIDFYRIMQVAEEDLFEENKRDADTLGGFIMEIHKELPKRRQKIYFHNYTFTIHTVDKKRIKRIEVFRKKILPNKLITSNINPHNYLIFEPHHLW
ncbi:MAG: gliding motility-associated protein GldE [Flavobacteriales bacterium]